jgi:hypothetical protein
MRARALIVRGPNRRRAATPRILALSGYRPWLAADVRGIPAMHRRIEENLAGQSDRFPDFDRHCGREYATDDQGIRELHRAGPARQRAHGVAGVISPWARGRGRCRRVLGATAL